MEHGIENDPKFYLENILSKLIIHDSNGNHIVNYEIITAFENLRDNIIN